MPTLHNSGNEWEKKKYMSLWKIIESYKTTLRLQTNKKSTNGRATDPTRFV